ncbi:type 1 glutamine amidotransferase domain-containing protein [Amycolatopsis acidicola]|uniref:Type 1 glutamine amidotransferase domain-containing protein n=1 Tax=Amycolatopsis acidicola TaxID=2596893 RepID=A0A5N0UV77_9PSEU|nr:type 1 glutamine amidotransferase domain-containing protein [Amycolatopsis acidicola]KAA9156707.1 type 1 glutamine amidotransferase domain-containing protein [Amycolatopsis acidicola]
MAKVLFVMTGADHLTLQDGTRHATGYWAEEAVVPLEKLKAAGHEVVVGTPRGVRPPVDEASLAPGAAGGGDEAGRLGEAVRNEPEFAHPVALSDVRLESYDAVFVPGGHGPMEDLAGDVESGRILTGALNADMPVALVCHGPAALLAAADGKGGNAFAGYRVAAFTNAEEDQGGLADKVPWLLQDRLAKAGLDVDEATPWEPHVVTDRAVLTGQNPASASPLADVLVERLAGRP